MVLCRSGRAVLGVSRCLPPTCPYNDRLGLGPVKRVDKAQNVGGEAPTTASAEL